LSPTPCSFATYKVGALGNIPFINGFVEGRQILKQDREVRDSTHIPIIHGSTAIIVETNAKGEPSLSSLFSPRAHAQVNSFAYPYWMHGVPLQSDDAQPASFPVYSTTAAFSSALLENVFGDAEGDCDGDVDGNWDGVLDGVSDGNFEGDCDGWGLGEPEGWPEGAREGVLLCVSMGAGVTGAGVSMGAGVTGAGVSMGAGVTGAGVSMGAGVKGAGV
jgi:hypothetical protein